MKSPWVVIPTYNEKGNIGQIVRGLQKTYPNLNLVVRTKKSGLGSAYIHGFTYALEHGADAIVQMDADFSHDPKDVVRLLHGLQNADLVIGSRYSHGISVINWPLRRLLISVSRTNNQI